MNYLMGAGVAVYTLAKQYRMLPHLFRLQVQLQIIHNSLKIEDCLIFNGQDTKL